MISQPTIIVISYNDLRRRVTYGMEIRYQILSLFIMLARKTIIVETSFGYIQLVQFSRRKSENTLLAKVLYLENLIFFGEKITFSMLVILLECSFGVACEQKKRKKHNTEKVKSLTHEKTMLDLNSL